ncbi:related to BUD2-GTPase-activating protein for Bud1p/Rsr1p [Zygosaccharomyces bailii ISA1307]|nr:related to BUD2-GTPase-activating protein for Bud1p/Rsr1p [Zygosaccharomyces bailii ISA1307]
MSNSSITTSFSGTRFDLDKFLSTMQSLKGTFQGTLNWSYDLHSNSWKTRAVEITDNGVLRCATDSNEDMGKDNGSVLIDHLQSCKVRFLDEHSSGFPTICVSAHSKRMFLRVSDAATFEELICAFIWWSGLRKNGIFQKFTPERPLLTSDFDATKVLVSQLYVFGPVLNKTVPIDKNMIRPDFLPDSELEEGWFPAMGVLKSNGVLDLLLQQDGTLIYSLNIAALLRSEIRIPDPSLDSDNYLFLNIIPTLREQLKISSSNKFVGTPKHVPSPAIILKFPLKIDVEDWFVALKSFAIKENFFLIGSDKSNHVRVSNSFSISILEGQFKQPKHEEELPCLYVELSMWGYVWGKAPVVEHTCAPFWREVFTFHESLKVNSLRIKIKRKSHNKTKDEMIGYIDLSQENINDPKLSKETRLPVLSATKRNEQIGTLCIKIVSSLILVLPSSNFIRMEKLLAELNLEDLCDLIQDFSGGIDVKIDNVSEIFLDIFLAIGRKDAWFDALLKKELSAVDDSIARNTIQNKPSSHIYSTLFRGNSILTISMEKYAYRVGHEYLDKSIGNILRDIINQQVSCELDPARIDERNPEMVEKILSKNRNTLRHWVGLLWDRIYRTSNDLPMGIKEQMKMFRKKLELICIEEDFNTTLNCVSGVLFLRFFCPVILNPKLFNLVSHHLNETSRRTLTLICKVLLNLSNITFFGNKEPFMIGMNDFIECHKDDLVDYIDKVTLKKLDFSPRILKLTSSVARLDLTMNEEELKELPVNPYLIDKYLRETEIFTFLASLTLKVENELSTDKKDETGDNEVIYDRPVMGQKLMIRGLEFEKITENNTEIFGNDLMKYLEEDELLTPDDTKPKRDFSNLNADVMGQLKQESLLLYHKIGNLTQMLSDFEYPSEVVLSQPNYSEYLADNTYYTKDKKLKTNLLGDLGDIRGLKKLFDFETKTSVLFDNVVPRSSSIIVERPVSTTSASESSSTISRNLTRLRSKRLPKIMSGNSEDKQSKEKSPGKLKRLFKRS